MGHWAGSAGESSGCMGKVGIQAQLTQGRPVEAA